MKKEKGITLVALVVTIVVLLILAGISLNLVLGQNGIITKAKEAREKTDEATTNTELFFNSTVDEIDKVIGDNNTSTGKVTDEEFRKNPTNYKHEDQSEGKKDIGIGTDGQPVNMDLWTYVIWWDNTVCLSGIEGSYNGGPGYQNDNVTAEGTIEGTVPRLIYDSKTDQVLPVTSMRGTFYNCTNLVTAPEIPDTVTEITQTFYGCTSLKKVSTIPSSVIGMAATFEGCTSLEESPVIPENVQNMNGTFFGCTKLTIAPTIPENVTDLFSTFEGCTSLITAPAIPENVASLDATFKDCTSLITAPVIPENVTSIRYAFNGCTNLTGTITINAELNSSDSENKDGCFTGTVKPIVIKGSSPYLAELAATAENGNVTVEQ